MYLESTVWHWNIYCEAESIARNKHGRVSLIPVVFCQCGFIHLMAFSLFLPLLFYFAASDPEAGSDVGLAGRVDHLSVRGTY